MSDNCKHCGACRNCDYCNCCGKCRTCGKLRPIDWSKFLNPLPPQNIPIYPVTPVQPYRWQESPWYADPWKVEVICETCK